MTLLSLLLPGGSLRRINFYDKEIDGWIRDISQKTSADFRVFEPDEETSAPPPPFSSPLRNAVLKGFFAALQEVKQSPLSQKNKREIGFFLRQSLPALFQEAFQAASFFSTSSYGNDAAKKNELFGLPEIVIMAERWQRSLYAMQVFLAKTALHDEEQVLGRRTSGVGVFPPPLVPLPDGRPLASTEWAREALEKKIRFSQPQPMGVRKGTVVSEIAGGFLFEDRFVILDRGERLLGGRWEIAALDQAGFFWPLPQGNFRIEEVKSVVKTSIRKDVSPVFCTWTQAVYAVVSLFLGGYQPLTSVQHGDLGTFSPKEANEAAAPLQKNASSLVRLQELLENAYKLGKEGGQTPRVGNAWSAKHLSRPDTLRKNLQKPKGKEFERESKVER